MARLTDDQFNQLEIIKRHLNEMNEELEEYRENQMDNREKTLCLDIPSILPLSNLDGEGLGFNLEYFPTTNNYQLASDTD